MNDFTLQWFRALCLPCLNLVAKAKVENIAFQQQASVEFNLVPRAESSDGCQQILVQFTGVVGLQHLHKTDFILHRAAKLLNPFWPIEVAIRKGQHHVYVDLLVLTHPFLVHGGQHARFTGNTLVHRAVVVLGAVFSMLDEFLVSVDFKRTGPVFLLDHKHGVATDDHHVDFPLSTKFSVRDTNGFKHVPTVAFPGSPADS